MMRTHTNHDQSLLSSLLMCAYFNNSTIYCADIIYHTPPFLTHEIGTTVMYTAVVGGSMDGRAAGGGVGGLRGLTVQCDSA